MSRSRYDTCYGRGRKEKLEQREGGGKEEGEREGEESLVIKIEGKGYNNFLLATKELGFARSVDVHVYVGLRCAIWCFVR